MIIPKVGYDVRKGSGRRAPPDVEKPTNDEEAEAAEAAPRGSGEPAPETDVG